MKFSSFKSFLHLSPSFLLSFLYPPTLDLRKKNAQFRFFFSFFAPPPSCSLSLSLRRGRQLHSLLQPNSTFGFSWWWMYEFLFFADISKKKKPAAAEKKEDMQFIYFCVRSHTPTRHRTHAHTHTHTYTVIHTWGGQTSCTCDTAEELRLELSLRFIGREWTWGGERKFCSEKERERDRKKNTDYRVL